MANISKIKVNNNEYNIKDAVSRAALGTLTAASAIPTAFANKIGYADYRTVTENGSSKHYIYFYKDDSDAPTNASTIPSSYLCKIDAAPFIKDGMVSSVTVTGGNLVITWNSDSTGVTTPTTIPLTDIFNPDDYYDKDAVDDLITNVQAGIVDIADNLTTDDSSKALSAKQGKVLQDNKANKNELTITAVTGDATKKNIQLKSGTSQEVLIAHQDISGKADKSTTVTNVFYDTTNNKLTKTINGSTSDIVTASDIVTDGGGYKKPNTGIPATDLEGDIPTSKITGLNTVATSGSYSDLSNKPKLDTTATTAQTTSSTEEITGIVKLHKIAKTGTYSDLVGKPSNVSSFTNDAGYQTSSQVTSAISSAITGEYTASTETLSLTLPTFTTA